MYLNIRTQSNVSKIEINNLVQELIPRYRLHADTDFTCSNENFIQARRIDSSIFQSLTDLRARALLDYYSNMKNINNLSFLSHRKRQRKALLLPAV